MNNFLGPGRAIGVLMLKNPFISTLDVRNSGYNTLILKQIWVSAPVIENNVKVNLNNSATMGK